ncbi:hypothetical protein AVEN_64320-1 [Araneus ventricosus]|uniref:Uncharacterized protein n=1 Tax=Araneus ventricosus TaxID=182803 RepID=A0A4Y2PI20_ARAVE|nr:hypothetical protein AVEN_64320-1 [Araneus ventricosus]
MIPPAPFSQNFRSTPEEGCMALNGFNMHQAHMHDRWGPMESNLEEKTLLLVLSQYGDHNGMIVESRFRGRRVTESPYDSIEDPPCMWA